MKKLLILPLLLTLELFSENLLKDLQENGVIIKQNGKTIHIKREKNSLCKKEHLDPEHLFGGDYAGDKVPNPCQKSFVTHVGVLQPMNLMEGIKTVGEVEVLMQMKAAAKEPSSYLLVDARTARWFNQITIPTAVNVPFNKLKYDEDLDEDDFKTPKEYQEYQQNYKKFFKEFGIAETKDGLDFSKAKTLLLFCNGSWCSQSPSAIIALINLGYPLEKLLWYRGGLQDWLIYDFTVIKNLVKNKK